MAVCNEIRVMRRENQQQYDVENSSFAVHLIRRETARLITYTCFIYVSFLLPIFTSKMRSRQQVSYPYFDISSGPIALSITSTYRILI